MRRAVHLRKLFSLFAPHPRTSLPFTEVRVAFGGRRETLQEILIEQRLLRDPGLDSSGRKRWKTSKVSVRHLTDQEKNMIQKVSQTFTGPHAKEDWLMVYPPRPHIDGQPAAGILVLPLGPLRIEWRVDEGHEAEALAGLQAYLWGDEGYKADWGGLFDGQRRQGGLWLPQPPKSI